MINYLSKDIKKCVIGAESKETIKHELNKAIQETEGEPVKEKADDE